MMTMTVTTHAGYFHPSHFAYAAAHDPLLVLRQFGIHPAHDREAVGVRLRRRERDIVAFALPHGKRVTRWW
jgi:hypothetical protein